MAREAGDHYRDCVCERPEPDEHRPEDVSGKYLPCVLLEQLMHRIKKTYISELVDVGSGDGDNGYGLLHSDFSPKPAYNAIKNMLGLLSDPGPWFQTTGLGFTLSGNLANVHHLLLESGTARFISLSGCSNRATT